MKMNPPNENVENCFAEKNRYFLSIVQITVRDTTIEQHQQQLQYKYKP